MDLIVFRPGRSAARRRPEVLLRRHVHGADEPRLVHSVRLGAGVRGVVDLMRPYQWHVLEIARLDERCRPLLRALVGDRGLTTIEDELGHADEEPREIRDAVGSAVSGTWLRVAVADALDRWLQLPLDQSLVDAERAVARIRAVAGLPPGLARQEVVSEALTLARRAARGLAAYLATLATDHLPPPAALRGALARLVGGYRDLLAEVRGPDGELRSVVRAGDRLDLHEGASQPDRWPTAQALRPVPRSGPSDRAPAGGWIPAGLIDPRHVPARVLELAGEPTTPEISLRPVLLGRYEAVEVTAPAYRCLAPDRDIEERLLTRLVDRTTGALRSEALMTFRDPRLTPADESERPAFSGTVALAGTRLEDIRVEVFDALEDAPAGTEATSGDLQEMRRAVVYVSEWRGMAAQAQLRTTVMRSAQRVRELAFQLASGQGSEPDRPFFGGGPSTDDLDRLADRGDSDLTDRLRRDDVASGAGTPLAAELAAVLEERYAS